MEAGKNSSAENRSNDCRGREAIAEISTSIGFSEISPAGGIKDNRIRDPSFLANFGDDGGRPVYSVRFEGEELCRCLKCAYTCILSG